MTIVPLKNINRNTVYLRKQVAAAYSVTKPAQFLNICTYNFSAFNHTRTRTHECTQIHANQVTHLAICFTI